MSTDDESGQTILKSTRLRRGQTRHQQVRGDAVIVDALVPLTNMFGYATRQKSLARATFAMRFDHYAPAPPPDHDPTFRPAMGMRA